MSDQRIYEEEIEYAAIASSNSEEIGTPGEIFNKDGDKVTFSGKLHLTEKEYEKYKKAKLKKEKIKEEEEKEKKEKEKNDDDELII